MAALGCLPPTVEPRATEHIAEMRTLIERLIASGNAYVADDHVLFSVPSMPDYGRLSKRLARRDDRRRPRRGRALQARPDGLRAVEAVEAGRAGLAVAGRHRGAGPPRLAHRMLGDVHGSISARPFDIHGGGIDLVFPHHENEIAQSRCAFHTPVMANIWMHNGFLQVEGEKMSKSLGNFVTIRELLRRTGRGEVLRFDDAAARTTASRSTGRSKGCRRREQTLDSLVCAAAGDAELGHGLSAGCRRCARGRSQHAEGHSLASRAAAEAGKAQRTAARLAQGDLRICSGFAL